MANCPKCNKVVYNRRRDKCEHCGALIPKELLLSEVQKNKLDQMKDSERKKFKEWKDEINKHTDHSDGGGSFLDGGSF